MFFKIIPISLNVKIITVLKPSNFFNLIDLVKKSESVIAKRNNKLTNKIMVILQITNFKYDTINHNCNDYYYL